MNILLAGLPMPPQSNNCYVTMKRPPFARYPSVELKAYQRAMSRWRLENLATANSARDQLVAKLKTEQRFIRIDRYFAFPRSKILTLAGTAKRLDASNRIKCLDDAIAEHVLGLDDSYFVSGFCEKVLCGPDDVEQAIVVMTHVPLRKLDDILGPGLPGYISDLPGAIVFQRLGSLG